MCSRGVIEFWDFVYGVRRLWRFQVYFGGVHFSVKNTVAAQAPLGSKTGTTQVFHVTPKPPRIRQGLVAPAAAGYLLRPLAAHICRAGRAGGQKTAATAHGARAAASSGTLGYPCW